MLRNDLSKALLLLLILTALPFYGQQASKPSAVPHVVNFSGKVTDAQGKPIPGVATISFAIYQEEEGGETLWTETQNVQADPDGKYTALLGSTEAGGLSQDLFSSGDARWLSVRINGGEERPRILLMSVPYALKAADAETLGGLPASAFALAGSRSTNVAAPALTASSPIVTSDATPETSTTVTTTGGTSKYLPLFTSANTIANSEIYDNGTNVGIGVVPNSSVKLDVGGSMIMRGNMIVSRTDNATSAKGFPSYGFGFYSNAYNSSTKATDNPHFILQSEPVGNNTSSTSANFNLLYSNHGTAPVETGFSVNPTGVVHFASGQTFPGTGKVSSVGLSAPSSDFTVGGSPVTSSGTLGFTWNVVPTTNNVANAIVKRDGSGSFTANTITANDGLAAGTADRGGYGVAGYNIGGGTAVYGNGNDGTGGGIGVYGTGAIGFATDSNVQQARTAGGWVKAMVYVNGSQSPYSIQECFNSTLTGAAATTPPCGIDLEEVSLGSFTLNFNFQVNDRFFSATAAQSGTLNLVEVQPMTSTQVSTITIDATTTNISPGSYWLMVY